jgi:hypothetical protein
VPFAADEIIICRYPADSSGTLAGAARVSDRATVDKLRAQLNGASKVSSTDPCPIDSTTYVFFVRGGRAARFNLDLTSCNAWMMPQDVIVDGAFAGKLRSLTPRGAGGATR